MRKQPLRDGDARGIDVEVIDPRTLKPLDLGAIVASVKKTGRLVIVEEGWRFCGLGEQIAQNLYWSAFDYPDGPIVRVTEGDVQMPYSRPLEDAAIPDVPVATKEQLTVGRRMNVTSSGDRRAIDGLTGAQCLKGLKCVLAHPQKLDAAPRSR